MANGLYITNAVALGMLNGTGLAEALGANPNLKLYAGAVPADADAANAGTLLGTLAMAAVPLASFVDANPGGRAVAGTITPDGSADTTGTLTFFRIESSAGVVKLQGTAGATACDLNMGTAAVTAGSVLSVSNATFTLPEGP